MKGNKDVEDVNDTDKMEEAVNMLRRDRVDDLANTASLLGSWLSDKKYTIAEQLATVELLRSSILVSYIQHVQLDGMEKFISEHPNAHIVTVDGTKRAAPIRPSTIDPTRS